jgi:hypothetical protein
VLLLAFDAFLCIEAFLTVASPLAFFFCTLIYASLVSDSFLIASLDQSVKNLIQSNREAWRSGGGKRFLSVMLSTLLAGHVSTRTLISLIWHTRTLRLSSESKL